MLVLCSLTCVAQGVDSIQTLKNVEVYGKRPLATSQTLRGTDLRALSTTSVADALKYFAGVLAVIACRGGSKLQRGGVLLGVILQRRYQFGALTRAERQHAGGQRVECAGMAGLHTPHTASLGYACTHKGQGSEARHTVWLVYMYYLAFYEVHLVNHYQ